MVVKVGEEAAGFLEVQRSKAVLWSGRCFDSCEVSGSIFVKFIGIDRILLSAVYVVKCTP